MKSFLAFLKKELFDNVKNTIKRGKKHEKNFRCSADDPDYSGSQYVLFAAAGALSTSEEICAYRFL